MNILNVGTQILLRDIMDQFLRQSTTDVRTFYASNMKSAIRFLTENVVHVMIVEVSLEDGSSERLLEKLQWRPFVDDLYVILALEEKRDDLLHLAMELEVNALLTKPFAGVDLKAQVDEYLKTKNARKKLLPDDPLTLVREAYRHFMERNPLEADRIFRKVVSGYEVSPAGVTPQYLTHAGNFFLNKPDVTLAKRCFSHALDLQPKYVPALTGLGRAFLDAGDLDRAEEFLSQADALSPLSSKRIDLSLKLLHSKILKTLFRVLEFDETNPLVRLELAKTLAARHDYVGALNHLKKALEHISLDATFYGKERVQEIKTYSALVKKLGFIQDE